MADTLYYTKFESDYLAQKQKEFLAQIAASVPSPLYGKKLAVLGDSISYGYSPASFTTPVTASYAKVAAERLGMTFVNHGITGSTVAIQPSDPTGNNPMVNRYTSLPDDADVIVFMGGTNDYRKSDIMVGTTSDTGTSTFYGALNTLALGLYTKYYTNLADGYKKTIVFCTPIKAFNEVMYGNVLRQYADAVKYVAQKYNFVFIDMYYESGINPHIMNTAASGHNPYIYDGVHPTQDGHNIIANKLVGVLKFVR